MNEDQSRTTLLRVLPLVFVFIHFYSCINTESSKKNNNTEKAATSTAVRYKKPSSSFNDTLIINKISAVFYNPDSLQLNKIQAITKNELYETDVHNCFYLMRNARMVLKKYWPQITIIETSNARFLLFVKKNTSRTIVDINSKNDIGGIFLFDMEKEPELIDMMNVNTALGFYFNK